MNKKRVKEVSGSKGRREFLEIFGGGALALAAPIASAQTTGRTLKIGYVSPQTGPLAGFGEVDSFVLSGIRQFLKGGIRVGTVVHPVEILVRDSQSSPNRAAEVASDLILGSNIDLMLVGSTPDNVNPVSDQCELSGVPCLSTTCPWQPWFFGRGGNPKTGFKWTYHFFWGLEDIEALYPDIWAQIPTNKTVGFLMPNDGDGNAWSNRAHGLPPSLLAKGYKIVDPGRFQPGQADFTTEILAYKKGGVQIVCGVVEPPDFKTFWTQALQQGFHPRAVTIGKALAFPSSVNALGSTADGLTQEAWWTPTYPFSSSLTKQSAAQFSAAYEQGTGKEWNETLGYAHALFELGIDVLKRTKDVSSKASIVAAIQSTNLDTIIGHVSWMPSKFTPVKNVCRTTLAGGQWVSARKYPYDLKVVANGEYPNIPIGAKMKAITYAA